MASKLKQHWLKILELRREGESFAEIARQLGGEGEGISGENVAGFFHRQERKLAKLASEMKKIEKYQAIISPKISASESPKIAKKNDVQLDALAADLRVASEKKLIIG